jgi:hypothetical protein
MLAHAFLVVAALTSNTRHPPPPELIVNRHGLDAASL